MSLPSAYDYTPLPPPPGEAEGAPKRFDSSAPTLLLPALTASTFEAYLFLLTRPLHNAAACVLLLMNLIDCLRQVFVGANATDLPLAYYITSITATGSFIILRMYLRTWSDQAAAQRLAAKLFAAAFLVITMGTISDNNGLQARVESGISVRSDYRDEFIFSTLVSFPIAAIFMTSFGLSPRCAAVAFCLYLASDVQSLVWLMTNSKAGPSVVGIYVYIACFAASLYGLIYFSARNFYNLLREVLRYTPALAGTSRRANSTVPTRRPRFPRRSPRHEALTLSGRRTRSTRSSSRPPRKPSRRPSARRRRSPCTSATSFATTPTRRWACSSSSSQRSRTAPARCRGSSSTWCTLRRCTRGMRRRCGQQQEHHRHAIPIVLRPHDSPLSFLAGHQQNPRLLQAARGQARAREEAV